MELSKLPELPADLHTGLIQTDLTPVQQKVAELTATKIASPEQYQQVALTLQEVKYNLKKLDEFEEREKRPHLDALNDIRANYAPLRTAFTSGEAALKSMLTTYDEAMKKLAAAAKAKADADAAKEREKLRRKADKALAKGDLDKAAELATQAETTVAPSLVHDPVKVSGISHVEVWLFEVIDPKLVPERFKVVDMRLLQRVVSAVKNSMSIPGVRIWSENRISSKSRQPT